MAKVSYKQGTKATYLGLAERSPYALYWCTDTKELFKGDDLYTDGVLTVANYAALPAFAVAAEGKLYVCLDNNNGYILNPERSGWTQVLFGVDDATIEVNESGLLSVKTIPTTSVEGLEARLEALEEGGGGGGEPTTSAANLYEATKDSLEEADSTVISDYISAEEITPANGDVFVINTVVSEVVYERSAYWYNGTDWVAITGNVDADKVIMRDDITMAGNYTQVGNMTKDLDGTADFSTKGMSVADILTEIFSKRLQPGSPTQPSISGFALTGAKAVEAGTHLDSVSYTAASLNPGSYQYGPATGVTASNWVVNRVTNTGTEQVTTSATTSLASGSDNNGGTGFTIGDMGGEGVVSSLSYKVTATHGAGVTANDNLGDPSNPAVSISAGSKEKTTSSYTAFRNYFYGATSTKPTLDSAYIRGLTPSGKAYTAGTITLNVAAGSQRVAIACMGDKTGVTKVINETALNADVTDTFTQSTVSVEGAEGYTAREYKVWVFEPAVPYENAATLKVTLG